MSDNQKTIKLYKLLIANYRKLFNVSMDLNGAYFDANKKVMSLETKLWHANWRIEYLEKLIRRCNSLDEIHQRLQWDRIDSDFREPLKNGKDTHE